VDSLASGVLMVLRSVLQFAFTEQNKHGYEKQKSLLIRDQKASIKENL
jgi:hypothetical protein